MNNASQSSDIPTKILKEENDMFAEFLLKGINSTIKSSTFPSCLKSAAGTPLHAKKKKGKKDNYRPVNILPTLSSSLTIKIENCSRQRWSVWCFVNWFFKSNWFSQSWTSYCKTKFVSALKLVDDYLSGRKQRTTVNNSYSTRSEILFEVP